MYMYVARLCILVWALDLTSAGGEGLAGVIRLCVKLCRQSMALVGRGNNHSKSVDGLEFF